jgi:hypothetical protein
MGRTDYLSGIDWKNRNPFRLLQHRTRAYDDCSCVVVGRVTPLRAYLDPHGDFDAVSNAPETFGNARLRFSLVRPYVTVPYFPEEFDTAVSNICRITHGLPASNCVVDDTFLTHCDDGTTMINFSWDLFEDVSYHSPAAPSVVLNVHPVFRQPKQVTHCSLQQCCASLLSSLVVRRCVFDILPGTHQRSDQLCRPSRTISIYCKRLGAKVPGSIYYCPC